MSESSQLVIHKPLDGETLEHYLGRYSIEEIQKIFELPEKLSEYCSVLLNTPWLVEADYGERSWKKVWEILRRTDNFEVLLHHINMWESTRRDLLSLLTDSASDLRAISKWCAGGRFIGCALESGSTVAGLFLEGTSSNYVLGAAKVFGVLALGSTFLEIYESCNKLKRLEVLVDRDQKLFAPIQNWYQQTEELEKAMKDVFPFDFTEQRVKEFIGVAEEEIDQVKIFERLLIAIAEAKLYTLRDGKSLQNIISFITSPNSIELFKWIVYNIDRHAFSIDLTRMLLQLQYSPLQYLFFQSVKALAPESQNLYSVPVMGRIGLNCFSCADALKRFWGQEVPGTFEMQKLKKHLEGELNALMKMINVIRPRRQFQ